MRIAAMGVYKSYNISAKLDTVDLHNGGPVVEGTVGAAFQPRSTTDGIDD
jgi:hypothetical protein